MNTIQIRESLTYIGPHAAEKQLGIIATNHSDNAIIEIVKELRPAEIKELLMEGDYTKPSIIVTFISIKQFIDSFNLLGSKWGQVDNHTTMEHLHMMAKDVCEYLCQVLLVAEPNRQGKLLRALLSLDIGRSALVMIAIDNFKNISFLEEFDSGMVEKGTWQEVYAVIEQYSKAEFAWFSNQVVSIQREGRIKHEFLLGTLQEMSSIALKLSKKDIAEEPEEIFVDI
jgi:hypothetical protein